MEIPVNILVRGKNLLGVLNIAEHQLNDPILVVMCYGFNGDRVEQHRMSVTMGRVFAENRLNFCRIDFRNQGLSEGTFDDFLFSEKIEDINEIIAVLKACFRNENLKVFLIGFSNGCKVAIDALQKNSDIYGAVLWNPILQELINKQENAGESRRLQRHPKTGKFYKSRYSLRLNIGLLYEMNADKSLEELINTRKNVLCILSKDDSTIQEFVHEIEKYQENDNVYVQYIYNSDHLFGSVDDVNQVISSTLNWILKQHNCGNWKQNYNENICVRGNI